MELPWEDFLALYFFTHVEDATYYQGKNTVQEADAWNLAECVAHATVEAKAVFSPMLYPPQKHINEYQKLVALYPQLLGVKDLDAFFGFRIA